MLLAIRSMPFMSTFALIDDSNLRLSSELVILLWLIARSISRDKGNRYVSVNRVRQ